MAGVVLGPGCLGVVNATPGLDLVSRLGMGLLFTYTMQTHDYYHLLLVPVVYEPESDAEDAYMAANAESLEAAGFKVTVRKALGGFFGTVRLQEPGSGQAPKGSTITLTIV